MYCGTVFLLVFVSLGNCAKDYTGYRIYEVIPEDEKQVFQLYQFSEKYREFDFLNEQGYVNTSVFVVVAPNQVEKFENRLVVEGGVFSYSVINPDISLTIKEQLNLEPRLGWLVWFSKENISFNKYQRYKDINKYLDKLAEEYSNLVRVKTIGKSYKKRDIKAITIDNGLPNANKKTVLIEAGIHGREWMSPATALFIIRELVENYEDNKEFLIQNKVIIIPLLNPDGYEHSHKSDRMWRKTRSPNKNPKCPGTDLNRNFEIYWGVGAPSDKNPECDEAYPGPSFFSETETRALRKFLTDHANEIEVYISLHSYGRKILMPWAGSGDRSPNLGRIEKVAEAAKVEMDKIKKNVIYTPRRVAKPVGDHKPFGGTALDYAHGKMNIPITVTVELSPDRAGFDPPKEDILMYAEEGWIVVKAIINAAHEV